MRRSIPAFLAMIAIFLFISACGSNSSSPSSLSAGQVLTNTASAMKQLKTVHLNMTLAATIGVSGLTTPTTGSSTPGSFTFNVNGNGDEVLPDQTSLQLSLNGLGSNYNFAVITKGQQVYIQNKQGQWYVIDKSKLSSGSSSNPISSASIPDFGKLLDLAQKNGKVTDHGDETLNGVSLRHITVTLDKNGIEQLLKSTGLLNNLTSTSLQQFNQFFNSAKDLTATLDFWIDESTFYIHRFEMKFNLNLDLSQFVSPTPGSTTTGSSGASVKFDMTIDLSKFNDSSIKISAPANAIPTDNPGVIFGSGA